MDKFIQIIEAKWTRIAAVVSIVVTQSVFLWPEEYWSFDPGKFVAFLSAIVFWFTTEFFGRNDPHPSDVRLTKRILAIYDEHFEYFIRKQNFGNVSRKIHTDKIFQISDLNGERDKFVDKQIQRRWSALFQNINKLADHLAHYGGISQNGGGHFFTLRTQQEEIQGGHLSAQTEAASKRANQLAQEIDESWPMFLKTAKSRLGDSFPTSTEGKVASDL